MKNPDKLNQLVLRTMLLEGSSCDAILNSIRKLKDCDTAEKLDETILLLRKYISDHTKNILSEETITRFISELKENIY